MLKSESDVTTLCVKGKEFTTQSPAFYYQTINCANILIDMYVYVLLLSCILSTFIKRVLYCIGMKSSKMLRVLQYLIS